MKVSNKVFSIQNHLNTLGLIQKDEVKLPKAIAHQSTLYVHTIIPLDCTFFVKEMGLF